LREEGPYTFLGALRSRTRFSRGVSSSLNLIFRITGEGCAPPDEIELYQLMLRVKYIMAATARKLAIAPTRSPLSNLSVGSVVS
jgi:hypothetical protein